MMEKKTKKNVFNIFALRTKQENNSKNFHAYTHNRDNDMDSVTCNIIAPPSRQADKNFWLIKQETPRLMRIKQVIN